MKRILLIDNTDERRKRVSSLLRANDLCSCEERKEVCNAKDAVDAVKHLQPFTAAQSRIKDEWKDCVVSPNGFDIVLLHTTNAYAKHYFQEWLTSNVVILFTGGSDYWHDCPGVGLDSRRHFFTTPAAIDEFICDFAFEFTPDVEPPWEVFQGRSVSAKFRERLFARQLLTGTPAPKNRKSLFAEDLAGEPFLKVTIERLSKDQSIRDEVRRLLANAFVQWSLAGCAQTGSEITSGTQGSAEAKQELERLLRLLCKPKR